MINVATKTVGKVCRKHLSRVGKMKPWYEMAKVNSRDKLLMKGVGAK